MTIRLAVLVLAAVVALAGCSGGGGRGSAGGSQPDRVVVWAVGDGAAQGDAPKAVAGLIATNHPSHVIYLGDVYGSGTAAEFRSNVAGLYGDLVQRMWPTPGNHEWPNQDEGYTPFWSKEFGRPIGSYYERSAGGWTILSANSQTAHDPAQLAWLRDHASGAGNCRIAFWHRPRLNAGRHRDEQRDVAGLWNAIRGRVAIVLSGHDHNMQRFKPVDGTVQYISGAGGRSLYGVDRSDPRLAWANDTAFGALKIELRPGVAHLAFVSNDGTTLDRSTVRCRKG